jgi:hypothetical protein
MKKIILAFFLLAGAVSVTNAQDVITKKNGDEIKAKVVEIGTDEVKYKRFGNESGPSYTLPKSEIFMIKYEGNGVPVLFGETTKTNDTQVKQQPIVNQSSVQKEAAVDREAISYATKTNTSFNQFHVGVTFPNGKFADGDEKTEEIYDGKGFAVTGFTIGYKHYSTLAATEGLSWVFGIEAYYNGLNSDYKDTYNDKDYDITFPVYLNFPATIGLNYALPLVPNVKIYGEAAIGGNFSMPTNFKFESSKYPDIEIKINSAFGFAYAFEAGLFIQNKYSIGLRYNNLGSYKYKYEAKVNTEKEKDKFEKVLPITNISLAVGLLF